jgi:thiosulfate/3-mercaptopyruvate sulfurtransferase
MGAAWADEGRNGRLVNPAWLQRNLAQVLVLDASVTPQHLAGHIPGAVSADLYRYGPDQPTPEAMQRRIRSWGVSPGRPVVLVDQGGDMMATRLFFDLYYHGVPADDLFILDGGMAGWRARGGAVTQDPTPPPAPGSFSVTERRESARVRLPEFLVASGDRERQVLVEALEPSYHYGELKFFDRAGHVPNAILLAHADFFNADKTFKSPDEIRRMLRYWGIRPDQAVLSHCGGGVAAAVPWFALQFLVGHPSAKLYLESQREWLRDDRGLPYWTYSAPYLQREAAWLAGWNGAMQRTFGVSQLNLVDLRDPAAYALGHVPYALNIPAATFRSHLGRAEALAALLGPAGVNPAHEVVLMADGGLTPDVALAFLAFEQLGHAKVSVMLDSVDEWGLRGHGLTKEPTTLGAPKSMRDVAVPPATYVARPRIPRLVRQAQVGRGEYPPVFVALGKGPASRQPSGPVLSLPAADLLNADGTPKPAKALWQRISQAGVPRHAEVVVFADDPAEAAIGYFVFRLMGWPDVKVWTD